MFYEKELMTSKTLGEVWRAGNYLHTDDDDDMPLPDICDNLSSWVANDDEVVHARLALRTSAIFINGAARLYKRKIHRLFDDIQKLDMIMTVPKRRRFLADSESDSSSQTTNINSSGSEISDSNDSNASNLVEDNGEYSLATIQVTNDDSEIVKVDKEVQTDLERATETNESFDHNLPFGFVVIHDNYYSRIPSKIIISSFNADVGKL